LKKSRDPNGVGFDAVYDLLGRVTSQTDTVGDVTSTSYDKAGNVKTQTDAKNKVTTTVYDVLGRTKGVTDRLTNQTSYAYDLAGRMTSITDAQACFLVQNHQLRRQCTGAVTAGQDRRNLSRSHGRELG
jgi:YD repeat-containing protein